MYKQASRGCATKAVLRQEGSIVFSWKRYHVLYLMVHIMYLMVPINVSDRLLVVLQLRGIRSMETTVLRLQDLM